MPLNLFGAAALALAIACASADAGSAHTYFSAPSVTLDLDLDPEERFLPHIQAVLANWTFDESFGTYFTSMNASAFAGLTDAQFAQIGASIDKFYPVFANELRGMSAGFATFANRAVSYDYLAAVAYYHELGHRSDGPVPPALSFGRECTGVLLMCPQGAMHGRNLDNSPADALRKLTVRSAVVKGGVQIGETSDWYWVGAGFVTLYVPGVVSLEENWRLVNFNTSFILAGIAAGQPAQSWVFRIAIADKGLEDFNAIVAYLEAVPNPAPCYLIASGPGPADGVVITKDPLVTYPTFRLDATEGNVTSTWFLVQTNYDIWLPDPSYDPRRTLANNALEALGQDAACGTANGQGPYGSQLLYPGLMSIMQTTGVLNGGTVVTATMSPSLAASDWYGQNVTSRRL